MAESRGIFSQVLKRLLVPIARYCLSHSLTLHELVECAKVAFLTVAEEDLKKKGQRITDSRLSVMTGVHRRDVVRLRDGDIQLDRTISLPTRVVGRWQSDKRFTTQNGKPRVLSVGFDGCDFDKLVALESTDMNPASVRFELERVGSVEIGAKGIKLIHDTYIPREDLPSAYQIVSNDLDDLILTAENNIEKSSAAPEHHLRTEYDKIRLSNLEEIRLWILKESHNFHAKIRDYLSGFDQDSNPQKNFKGKTGRVVFSSFSRSERGIKEDEQ